VDRDGMIVSDGTRLAPRARAAVITPAHQKSDVRVFDTAAANGAAGLGNA